jgi:hypothetical protein
MSYVQKRTVPDVTLLATAKNIHINVEIEIQVIRRS